MYSWNIVFLYYMCLTFWYGSRYFFLPIFLSLRRFLLSKSKKNEYMGMKFNQYRQFYGRWIICQHFSLRCKNYVTYLLKTIRYWVKNNISLFTSVLCLIQAMIVVFGFKLTNGSPWGKIYLKMCQLSFNILFYCFTISDCYVIISLQIRCQIYGFLHFGWMA